MLTRGVIKNLTLVNFTGQSPPVGKNWLILYGTCDHTTGTDTELRIYREKSYVDENIVFKHLVAAAASANGIFNIFSNAAGETYAQQPLIVIVPQDYIVVITGASGDKARLVVLEW